jgi:hypothetical protein
MAVIVCSELEKGYEMFHCTGKLPLLHWEMALIIIEKLAISVSLVIIFREPTQDGLEFVIKARADIPLLNRWVPVLSCSRMLGDRAAQGWEQKLRRWNMR